jgi:hypothetical protein
MAMAMAKNNYNVICHKDTKSQRKLKEILSGKKNLAPLRLCGKIGIFTKWY